jgi:hypothetical protein
MLRATLGAEKYSRKNVNVETTKRTTTPDAARRRMKVTISAPLSAGRMRGWVPGRQGPGTQGVYFLGA